MIAEINHIGYWELVINMVLSTILHAAMFIICLSIACKRNDLGFRVLATGTGILLLGMGCTWAMHYLTLRPTLWISLIGQATMVIGFFILLRASYRRNSVHGHCTDQEAEQGGDADAEEAV